MKEEADFSSPIKSDLEFMYFIINLYLEQNHTVYKKEIENVIKTTHNLVSNKIESREIDPVIFSIVTALKSFNIDYFRNNIDADHITKANIETVRGFLSTIRHSTTLQ
jgi:hypothetical protein